jgi:DNA-binding CsgD family transcriptional regulator
MNSDDDGGGHVAATSPMHRLAEQVSRDGLVRLTVGRARLVCLTEESFDRLTGRAAAPTAPESGSRAVHLSPREEQVLRLVGDGLTAAETAAVLGLAVNTVSQHLVSTRRKYGVTSTRAAVAAARRSGQL